MEYLQASPRGAATALLAELFAAPSEDRARGAVRSAAFTLAEHQEEAVRRARRILRERGGVLIADGVGLGKTYVALALIEEELSRGGRVLVAVPAALRSAWARPLQRLGHTSGCLRVTTHTRLSRGTGPAPDSAGFSLAVVDEAHRFRNPRTRRYHALAALCASARAVLITATPINNRLDDLHHLLRLFTDDDAFHDLGVARDGLRSCGLLLPRPACAATAEQIGSLPPGYAAQPRTEPSHRGSPKNCSTTRISSRSSRRRTS